MTCNPHHFTYSEQKRNSLTLVKCLLSLVILFAITTTVFVGLFTYYYGKFDEAHSREAAASAVLGHTQTPATTTPTTPTPTTTASTGKPPASPPPSTARVTSTTTEKVMPGTSAPPVLTCNTPNCVTAASAMLAKMNSEADPCENFSEFACGRFNKESKIADGSHRITSYSVVEDVNSEIVRTILEEEVLGSDPEYLVKVKNFYKSCMDVDQMDAVGTIPFLNESEFINDWPTLNPDWNSTTFDLKRTIAKFMRVNTQPIYHLYVYFDSRNPRKNELYVLAPELVLPPQYYLRNRDDPLIMARQTYLTEMTIELGADPEIAAQDAKDVVDLERAISLLTLSSQSIDNRTTLAQLDVRYPELGISAALKSTFEMVNITLEDNDTVNDYQTFYMATITLILDQFSNRTIQNLFGCQYAHERVKDTTTRMREIWDNYDKVYYGISTRGMRWEECNKESSEYFWEGVSRQYVDRTSFSEEAEQNVVEMIQNLKAAFRGMIEELTWMGNTTKSHALAKLDAIKYKVGYPDSNFETDDINKQYDEYTMLPDNYYHNRVQIKKLNFFAFLRALKIPVSDLPWAVPPYKLQAYYYVPGNGIVINAALLQPPWFSQTFQDAANYGGIGAVIGHELTHGFDNVGSTFDENGTLRNWWEAEDRAEFANRTSCLAVHYSKFVVPEVNMAVNGTMTLGENIADIGGIKEAFRAYKKKVSKDGEQPLLPGLGLTNDQLFFLSFGQMYCEKATLLALRSDLRGQKHPPSKYRILGTLRNTPDFAQAYNCQPGSYMNPNSDTCQVW